MRRILNALTVAAAAALVAAPALSILGKAILGKA